MSASLVSDQWLRGLPKAELHLHLEGSLEPQMLFSLAARNRVKLPFATVDEVRQAYRFRRLDDFLAIYYQGMSVLQTSQDFHDLTLAYLQRAHADGVVHAEVFFDPQGHTRRRIAFATVIDGILSGLQQAQRELGITHRLILCFLRDLDEADALATLDQARPYLPHLAGVGLDSTELRHPPSKFARAFATARSLGLKLVAHAGEEGPPAYVREALDVLGIDRLDHGNRSLEDAALIERLRASQSFAARVASRSAQVRKRSQSRYAGGRQRSAERQRGELHKQADQVRGEKRTLAARRKNDESY